ncbi:MAG TPA: YncE family protein, partial [Solirubrobacterales bacterium]|nr:YncE family protein [Solirubrobacterales bacterium]
MSNRIIRRRGERARAIGLVCAVVVGLSAACAAGAQANTAYVTNTFSGNVTPIATATNTAGTPITVGGGPIAIAITPDGATAYVTNYSSDSVTPIATATNTAGTPITVGTNPFGIAITPPTQTPPAQPLPPTTPAATPSSGKDPKCKHLRKKLKRQKGNLAKASTDAKRSMIQANIKNTKRRLKKLG